MSKMMMLLAALTVFAFAALPAVASAGAPQTHCPLPSPTCTFSHAGGTTELYLTGGGGFHCSSFGGSGTMGTSTGVIIYVLTGCTETTFNSACTTPGKASGTIESTALTYHNIYAADNKTSPAVLITPNATSGVFTHFACAGGLVSKTIAGNGLIGTLTSPVCGGGANAYKFSFEQSVSGHQRHSQSTGTGTVYDLVDGTTTASVIGSGEMKISGGGAASLTCV